MPLFLPVPAIIERAPDAEVRFGLSVGVSQVGYDRFRLPRDFPEAALAELLPYIPAELRHLPSWVLLAMLPGIGFHAPLFAGARLKTTTILTGTSASDQTWTVLADWNSADNSLNVVSSGADGSSNGGGGGGGGGGGFAKATNQTLTASGSAKYRLRAGNAGSGTANASWIGGAATTSLATSLCGIQCAGGNSGASTTSAIGATKSAGGNGGGDFAGGCCTPAGYGGGGGAAGPSGAGGAGVSGSAGTDGAGGTANNGATAGGFGGGAGNAGSEFSTAGSGSGGGGNGSGNGGAGGLYGGGGGSASPGNTGGAGKQSLIVTVNNASL